MRKIIFFLIISLLYLASAQALCSDENNPADCTVDHSMPIITMTYPINVSISSATMTWIETTDNIQLTFSGGPRIFEFTPDNHIVNGNYKLVVKALDYSDHSGTAVYYFEVAAPAMEINIESPKQWEVEGPDRIIGTSQVFNINLTTEEYADCKYTTTESIAPNINFTTSNGTTHIIENFDLETKTLNGNPEGSGSWKLLKVHCINPDEEITVEQFFVSYLSDLYILEPSFDNNPMKDYGNKISTLTIPISNQKLFCGVVHEEYTDEFNQGDFYLGTTTFESSTFEDYKQEPEHFFDYTNANIPIEGNTPFNLTCWNLAGLEQQASINLDYEFEETFEITKIAPEDYVSTGSFDVVVETEVEAECYIDYLTDFQNMLTEQNTTHTKAYSGIGLGTHLFVVKCEGLATYENGELFYTPKQINFEITVDTSKPDSPQVIAQNNSCGLISLEASFTAEDLESGIDYYNYSIWHSGSILNNWTRSDNNALVILDLIEGDSYEWQVKATNNAGLESVAGKKTVKATTEDDSACDDTNPLISHELIEGDSSINVNITCTDSGSGCTGAFTYSIIELAEICDYEIGNNKNYGDLITVSEDSLFCARVTDMAGNADTENFEVIIPITTNPYACQESSDCAPGSYCEEGICYPDIITGDDCTVDTSEIDCETEELCMNGFCQTPGPCTINSDCAGNYCVSNICTAPHEDTDNDGIPDWWEWKHFNCVDCALPNEDPDGDNYNNYKEYNAGTDPNDSLSYPLTDQPASKSKLASIILFMLALVLIISGSLLYNYHPEIKETQELIQKQKTKQKSKKVRTSRQVARTSKLRKKVSRRSLFSSFREEEKEEKKKSVMEEFEPADIKKKTFDKIKYKKALQGMLTEKKINKVEAGNMVLELFNSKKINQDETKELMKELNLI
jgi:uncharacterized protein YxeA